MKPSDPPKVPALPTAEAIRAAGRRILADIERTDPDLIVTPGISVAELRARIDALEASR